MNFQSSHSLNPSSILLDNLLDGILIIEKAGKIVYANHAASELFAKTHSSLVNSDFGFVVVPRQVQEIQILRKDKLLFAQMLANSIQWENKEALLVSLRDISALKKTEVDLNLQRQKLEQTNFELLQYTAMVSHDLTEPVRKILMFSGQMIDNHAGEIKAGPFKLLTKINKSAKRLSALITGISKLNSVKGARLKYSNTDINNVIDQVIEDIEVLINEKKVAITVEELPTINCDPYLLHQLFLNLITNSIKYCKVDASPIISISGKQLKDTIYLTLEDNGIGFDNKYADKIFQPFERLKENDVEGSGIGLAICKRIVNAHEGLISVQSKAGSGTRFEIALPKGQINDVGE